MKIVPEHIHQLSEGEECLQEVLTILNEWPQTHGEYSRRLDFWSRPPADQQRILKVFERLKTWVEMLAIQRALHDQLKLSELTTIVKSALTEEPYNENAIDDAERVRREFRQLVESMPIVNRAGSKSCACLSEDQPVVRRSQSRPRPRAYPRAYRHTNPKWQRKA
jgi:hypothetical protein